MKQGLRRDIGFTGSAFLSFNGMIGAGIFALPATLLVGFGSFSPWLFPLFGALVLTIVLPFARLASHFPGSGGPVAYTAAFGPIVSFQIGWIFYVARATALAANANVFATYAGALVPGLAGAAGRIAVIALLVGGITAVNILGVRRAIRLLDVLTLLKALPLIGLALWGLVEAGMLPGPAGGVRIGEIEAAVLLVLYAFVGLENSVVPAGETKDAERTIPRALIATVVATAALYFLIQLAYVAIMPAGEIAEAPLVAMADRLAGPAGAILLTAAALFSVAGNISGSITATPRVTYALAEDGLLPRWFGKVGARGHTPVNSILFMAGIGLVLAISGSFVWLAVVSTLARLIVYSVCIAALPAAERKAGRAGGIALWLFMLPGLGVCLWAALQSEWRSWAVLAALLALGFFLSLIARLGRRPSP